MTIISTWWHGETKWDPSVPHCSKERRILAPDGSDGGGHAQCLVTLNADGSCPREAEHHDVYVAKERLRTTCREGSHLATCTC